MMEVLNTLLVDLKEAYDQSDIKKYCQTNGHDWYYSLITSTLEKHGPMVIGFNWGASDNESYLPQSSIEKCGFEKADIGSLSRIFPYCQKYYGDDFLSKISQSNYCFFRSKIESQISNKDIQLCEPIFTKMIDVVKPSSVLCFSSKLRDKVITEDKIISSETHDICFKHGARNITYTAIKAVLDSNVEMKFLPHPNYPMKKEARDEAWEFCCG